VEGKVFSDVFGRKIRGRLSAPFGKGTVEMISRDWTVTWLKQEGRMDG
jgi:hypothetical protein